MRTELAPAHDAAGFARGLLDPLHDAPAGLRAPPGASVAQRYAVYRNNVTVSLIDALAAIYPAVQRITGVEFFRAMARFHLRETPPVSPLLFEYGHAFPDFIAGYAYASEMPWLADTARVERAWLDAYHAADAAPLTAEAFSTFAPDTLAALRFTVHPATRIVRSRHSAVSIFAMNREDAPVRTLDAGTPEDALVTRPDADVIVTRLPEGGAAFLTRLIDGAALGEAVAIALQAQPAFDLTAHLGGMLDAGVFSAARLGD